MLLTDPPYGITRRNKWDVKPDLSELWNGVNKAVKERGMKVLTCVQPFTSELIQSNIKQFKYTWVWDKVLPAGHLTARYCPMKRAEDIAVFCEGASVYNPQGLVYEPRIKKRSSKSTGSTNYDTHGDESVSQFKGWPVNILRFKRETGFHPTQKPVGLMEYLIRTYTAEGGQILEPFAGSGTTLIAAMQAGRKAVGIELSEKYCEIAVKRIESIIKGG